VPRLDQGPHLPEEEGEEEGADVAPVDVGVAHQHDLVVAEAGEVEILQADARADGGDHRPDLLVGEHLVQRRLLHVDELAAKREDRLEPSVARLLGGAARRVPLDQVELADRRVGLGTVGELAGERLRVERPLAPGEIARLPRRLARPGGGDALVDDLPGLGRVLLEELGEPLVHDRGDDPLDLAVSELGLGLPLELGVVDLDADDRGQPLADILAAHRLVVVLGDILLPRVGVDGAGERRLEAAQVRPPLDRADVVRVGEERFRVAVVVLQGDLRVHPLLLAVEVDDPLVEAGLVLVEVLDEGDDPAVVLEPDLLVAPLVLQGDLDPRVEEGELPEAHGEGVEVVVGDREDLAVRLEGDLGAGLGALADHLDPRGGLAALELLAVDLPVPSHLRLEPLAQGVDAGDADAVQPPRDLVRGVVELAPGVERREHDLQGGLVLGRVLVHRDAAPVVDHRDGAVDMDDHVDLLAVARHRLVDRVVHHLVDQVVEPPVAGVPDVHRGALAHRLDAVEHRDRSRVVPGHPPRSPLS